jgi:hypothetical protein
LYSQSVSPFKGRRLRKIVEKYIYYIRKEGTRSIDRIVVISTHQQLFFEARVLSPCEFNQRKGKFLWQIVHDDDDDDGRR